MNILKPNKIEDYIIMKLIHGEQLAIALLSQIRTARKQVTKQGFYAALRKLKSEDIVLMYKGRVSLNTVWIKKMNELFEEISRDYTTNQKTFDVLGLENKESISYTFSNIRNLDTFWGHAQNILLHNTASDQPIYAYDPHYWFYIARRDTEKELLDEIIKNKRQFLMSVGYKSTLDKIIKSDFNSDYTQYNYDRQFDKDNYYITIIGDYITEVWLDETISKKINEIYDKDNVSTNDQINILKSFLEAKVRNKIKISKNKARAEKLKKRMGKNFYIIRKKSV